MKKKYLLAFFLVAIVVTAVAALTACGEKENFVLPKSSASLSEEVVRIHIRANSNGEEDQRVKLVVRDSVTAYLSEKLEDCACRSDALETLEKEKENLRDIAKTTLYENGFDYDVRVSLKKEAFPERVYDGYVFPEGVYDALIISLGEGKGDNWWCVAFPPLCFLPASNGEEIVYVSWVKELLDSLFR